MHARVAIRPAVRADLVTILRLYAEGAVERSAGAATPGGLVTDAHVAALEAIRADPNNCIYVAELDGAVAGTFQLTFIRQLSYGGCLVAQVESVFVDPAHRSRGVGTVMLEYARAEAERRGAYRLQLTSNLRRESAHRFYERLGYRATHKGMKLYLEGSPRGRRTEP